MLDDGAEHGEDRADAAPTSGGVDFRKAHSFARHERACNPGEFMDDMPETHYARSGEYHIAYQVIGKGPFDLVFIPGFVSSVEGGWEYPQLAHFYRRLASFARVILFDKRGTGMSDPVPARQFPTLEQRMDDVRAVMDAAGSRQAALIGVSEGGPLSLLFAASHPARTSAIVLIGAFARIAWAPDHPFGAPLERLRFRSRPAPLPGRPGFQSIRIARWFPPPWGAAHRRQQSLEQTGPSPGRGASS